MPDAATRDSARTACTRAIEETPALRLLHDAGRRGARHVKDAMTLVAGVRPVGGSVTRLRVLRRELEEEGLDVRDGAFERFLVLTAALASVDRVAQLPIDERVKELFYRKFTLYATSAPQELFDLDRASFVAMANVAALARFPAGQLDWVVSGIPRSWLFRVRPAALPRLLKLIAVDLGGFGPMFFSHLDATRPNAGVLLERESLRSYHRMARSMARQPAIKGFVTASWFHAPETFAVSPHLAWTNTVFHAHGGHVLPLGRANPAAGVLHRSPERQRAYDNGTFRPMEALVIWPRRSMLAWAADRQDLVDARLPRQTAAAGARA